MAEDQSSCPSCGYTATPGETTITADRGSGVFVVRKVPTLRCRRCREEWIPEVAAARLELLMNQTTPRRGEAEVLLFP
jgi:YgiT-type zinc finger domain-containing protein